MLPRLAETTLRELSRGFPVVAITGPRQSGRTTLARACFPHLPYFNLEDPDTRELAWTDPRRFLGRLPDGAVLDEVQRVPHLMSYLLGGAEAADTVVVYGGEDDFAREDHRVIGWRQVGLLPASQCTLHR